MSQKTMERKRTGRFTPFLRGAGLLAAGALVLELMASAYAPARVLAGFASFPSRPNVGEVLLQAALPGRGAAPSGGFGAVSLLGFLFPLTVEEEPASPAEPPAEAPAEEISPPPEPAEPPAQEDVPAGDAAEAPADAGEDAELPENAADLLAVTFAPSSPDGYNTVAGVFINNQTSLKLDSEALAARALPLKLRAVLPQILIIHTHASESYFPDERDYYVPTDIERTEDTRFNVVRVGDELAAVLEQKGLHVIHDRNIYDHPSYNASYSQALKAITKIIEDNPSIQIVIDIHRDSIVTAAGTLYKTIADLEERDAAQMMFVVGSSDFGLPHPGWKDNLAMAVQLQKRFDEQHPTLMRPVNLRKERFNQHATSGSLILEVGTSGNTLQEALAAIRLFGETAGDFWLEYVAQP